MYSYKKSIEKALLTMVQAAIFLVSLTSFADTSILDLMQQHFGSVLGSMTLVGALRFAENWLKHHNT